MILFVIRNFEIQNTHKLFSVVTRLTKSDWNRSGWICIIREFQFQFQLWNWNMKTIELCYHRIEYWFCVNYFGLKYLKFICGFCKSQKHNPYPIQALTLWFYVSCSCNRSQKSIVQKKCALCILWFRVMVERE